MSLAPTNEESGSRKKTYKVKKVRTLSDGVVDYTFWQIVFQVGASLLLELS